MLDQIFGKIISSEGNSATIDIHGIGLKLLMPTRDIASLPPNGEQVTLFTAFFFKEPQFELFGFLKKESRHLFYQLTQVNGIGPKTAIQILSAMRLEELYQSIHKEDAAFIAKVPGIGKKTAQRLILEMKSKVPNISSPSSSIEDALLALQNLGFQEVKAKYVLQKIYKENREAKTDELITLSLRQLS